MQAIFLAVVLNAAFIGQPASGPATMPADPLATLVRDHPRLILTEQRLGELKKQMAADPTLARYAKDVVAKADGYLKAKPLEHKLIGPRLLSVSREAVNRITTLGLAWRISGQEDYARAMRENLLTVCEFPDWNPSHFLDTAEMSHAVGVGYDWLHGQLDEPTRRKVREALIGLGLKPGIKVYQSKGWWAVSEFNWNQVCNGGMVIGALAIAETDPEYARQILPGAARSLPKALASYEPDGAWGEGPGYWNYATSYTVYGLAAMQSALGTDFGLSERKGLANAGDFPLYAAGPTGLFVNYADAGERSALRSQPTLYWLGRRYGKPYLAAAQARLLDKGKAGPWDLIWYLPADKAGAADRELDRLFRGMVELAVFRSAWDDPDALFASLKAGYNAVNHGHLDLGQFELDALGQRWARDLGSDDYNLPGYWDGKQGGQRWRYYRLGSFSHNVVLLDGRQQLVAGKAKLTKFHSGAAPCGVLDLTSAYGQAVKSARRGVMLTGQRRAVLVQDEIELNDKHDVAWGMTTDAAIAADGATARLKLGGQELVARIISPAGATFDVASAEQKPPEKTNKGVSRLTVRLADQTGLLRLAVLLSPVWPEKAELKTAEPAPLDEWGK
jgi:hypothetical protein